MENFSGTYIRAFDTVRGTMTVFANGNVDLRPLANAAASFVAAYMTAETSRNELMMAVVARALATLCVEARTVAEAMATVQPPSGESN